MLTIDCSIVLHAFNDRVAGRLLMMGHTCALLSRSGGGAIDVKRTIYIVGAILLEVLALPLPLPVP